MSNRTPRYLPHHSNWLPILLGILGLACLYATSRYNFLLFHCLAEAFSIVIAIAVFAIFWNTRRFFEPGFYLIIGFGCLFAGLLDLIYVFGHPGMSVFPGANGNVALQAKTVAQWYVSLSCVCAVPFLRRKIDQNLALVVYSALLVLALASIFYWRVFPDCFVEGVGFTPFARIGLVISCSAYLGALVLLVRNRREFDTYVFKLLAATLIAFFIQDAASAVAEDLNGFAKTLAHLCQIVAIYFVYKAFVEMGLTKPYDLLFRSQQQSAEALERQQQFLEAVLDNAQSGIVACDANGVLVLLNRALREFHGLPQAPTSADRWSEHYDLYHLDGKTRMRTEEIPLFRALQGEHVHDVEMMVVPKAGPARTFVASGEPLRGKDGENRGAVVAIHDITDRKQAEEALRAEVEFRRVVMQRAAEGLCVCHDVPDYPYVRFTIWNDRMEQITGYTMDEINRQGWYQSVYPDPELQARAIARMARMRQSDDLLAEEWEITRADGSKRQLQISTSVVHDSDGTRHVLALMHDVTDRKRAEEALRESHDQLARLADNLPHSIVYQMMPDANGNRHFTYFSAAAERILGITPEEVKADAGVLYRQILEPFRPAMERAEVTAATNQSLFDAEVPVRMTDGTVKWLHICSTPYQRKDGQTVWDGIATDITDRKHAEEALRQSEEGLRLVLEASGTGWWSLDLASAELTADDRCKAMFGLPSTTEPSFALFRERVFPDDRLVAERHLAEARGQPGDYEAEYRTVWPDGSLHWLFIKGRAFHDTAKPCIKGIVMDVTDRKRAEEALRASEENFRTFFNSVDEYLFVLNQEGCILHINDTATVKLRYTQEELIGKSVLCLHPEDRREEAARIVADMSAGKVATCPLPVVTKEGRLIPVETRVVKGKWNGHDVLFGISKDLSELRASEERFFKAFHSNPSLMAITSLTDNRFIDVNESFLRTLGYERHEVLGATTAELSLFADPGQRTAALAVLSERGVLREFEADVRTKDGQVRHGLFSAEFIQLQDQQVLLTVMNDITDRKRTEEMLRESEERHRLLVETIPQLAWRSSADGLDIDCNRRWYEYTGQTPARVRAHGWLAAVHPDDLFRVAEQAAHAASTRESYEIEYRLRRASDGSYRWHLARAIPSLGEDGQVTCWFGSATDIEDLKQAQEILNQAHEEQLERHRAELAHVARLSMMGEMAASLAHELNQPLHAINNYASGSLMRLLKTPQRDQELVTALEKVSEEANRAAEIVRRVKWFVQKRESPFSEVSVNRLVEEVVLLSKAELEQRHAKVALELSDNLPVVMGDPVQIEQVIMNLVRNGLEAMEETPEENRLLGIKTMRRGDEMVQLEVCDRGKGIGREDLAKVFEPFFTTKPEGMGMGLAISRSIVRAHGGRLWLSADQDQGCTFHFTLPVGERS